MRDQNIWHVEPQNDLKEHISGTGCHCQPRIEEQPGGGKLVIHNAYDNREFDEIAEKINGETEYL